MAKSQIRCRTHWHATVDTSIHTFAHMRTSRSFDFIMWARELQSSPERSCELADRPQTSTHCPHDLLSTSRHSHGRGMVAARAQWSTCSSPQAGRAMRHHRRHTPVGRNRMRARCSLPTPPPASGAALPGVMEGGAAEAAEKAAAEPPSEPRAGRAEACLQTGAREVRIDLASTDASGAPR